MKKTSAKAVRRPRAATPSAEIQPEYDWRAATRNPYASRYAQGSNIVVLEPDVAAQFPNAAAVNEALRSLTRVLNGKRKP
jgi:hypothetical protein